MLTHRHNSSRYHRAPVGGRLAVPYNRCMETTKLSSRGQVVLPKSVRDAHGWASGTEFTVELMSDGVRLRRKGPFVPTGLGQVVGSVTHVGPAKSLEDMDAGIRTAVSRRHRRGAKR